MTTDWALLGRLGPGEEAELAEEKDLWCALLKREEESPLDEAAEQGLDMGDEMSEGLRGEGEWISTCLEVTREAGVGGATESAGAALEDGARMAIALKVFS